jgi:hypothetical protein
MSLADLGYIIAAATLILTLTLAAERKVYVFLILVWLLMYPIMARPEYTISIGVLGFDIQPIRFLFLVLGPIVFFQLYDIARSRAHNIDDKVPKIETNAIQKWMVIYILFVIIALLLNIKTVGQQQGIVGITNTSVFLLMFLTAKWFITPRDFNLLTKAIILFAIFSAVVGLVQFFIKPDFFRVGVTRAAFGEFSRANGLFANEYEQGFFLIISLFLGLSTYKNIIFSLLFTLLMVAGVFVTMHRLGWVVLLVASGLYIGYFAQKNLRILIAIAMSICIIFSVLWMLPWDRILHYQFIAGFIRQRLSSDTLTGRIQYYKFGLGIIKGYPFGIGSYYTNFYNQAAFQKGMPLERLDSSRPGSLSSLVGYIIHDGVLSAGILYGIPGMTAFMGFLVVSINWFIKRLKGGVEYLFPLIVSVVFLLYNTTQDFSNLGTQVGVFYALVLGYFVSKNSTNSRETF